MKYVILEKARPYTRVKRGKMERVKGYPSREKLFSPALEEATVHQIAKDYAVTKEEARMMYRNMFAEEKPEKGKEKGKHSFPFSILYDHIMKEKKGTEEKPFDPLREHLEWERRVSGKFGKDRMVVALRTPKVGDEVLWTDRHSGVADPKDRPLTVMGFQGNMIVARDAGGMDLMVHPSDLKILPKHPAEKKIPDMDSKIKALASMIEQHQAERYAKDLPRSEPPKVKVKPGGKYIKIDVGSSGKYMVEKATGDIYGIKGYGVIHRGHYYGNLDTIGDYFWGEYTAFKKKKYQ